MQIIQGIVVGVSVVLITQYLQAQKTQNPRANASANQTGGGVLASATIASEQVYV